MGHREGESVIITIVDSEGAAMGVRFTDGHRLSVTPDEVVTDA